MHTACAGNIRGSISSYCQIDCLTSEKHGKSCQLGLRLDGTLLRGVGGQAGSASRRREARHVHSRLDRHHNSFQYYQMFFLHTKVLSTKHVLLLRSSSGMNQSLDLDTLCLRSWSQNARHYIGVKELGGSPGSIYVNTYTRDIQGLNGPDA